jgi:hypothetical protein
MMLRTQCALLLAWWLLDSANAWIPAVPILPAVKTGSWTAGSVVAVVTAPTHTSAHCSPSSSPLFMAAVDSLSLDDLDDDHERVGQELADSLQRMLDAEWMPQAIHAQMAASVKGSYIRCRNSGQADLMTIMTTAADDLLENWSAYDKDAFVGAWDVANYASDFLASKTGIDGCECTQKLY